MDAHAEDGSNTEQRDLQTAAAPTTPRDVAPRPRKTPRLETTRFPRPAGADHGQAALADEFNQQQGLRPTREQGRRLRDGGGTRPSPRISLTEGADDE